MSNAAVHGADEPRGPGWWKASDGRYYPPELAPDASARKPKKALAKKASAKSVPSAEAEPKQRKATAASNGSTESIPKRIKPATADDQMELRRTQAKQQVKLLAGARQQAALRALASLGGDEAPQLVGVGSRSLDARSGTRDPSTVVEVGKDEAVVRPAESPMREKPVRAPEGPPTRESRPAKEPPGSGEDEPGRAEDGETEETSGTPEAATAPVATAPPGVAAADPPEEPPEATSAEPRTSIGHQPGKVPPEATAPMGTEVPFMEVKGSALGADIDRIGEKVLIFADRVELRDRANQPKSVIRYDELAGVEVQKKIMGPTLQINGAPGQSITAKALRPELASGAKAMIEKHAERFLKGGASGLPSSDAPGPPSATPAPAGAAEATAPAAPPLPPPAAPEAPETAPVTEAASPAPHVRPPMPHPSILVGMLEELHAAGVLSAEELEEKRSLLEQRRPRS